MYHRLTSVHHYTVEVLPYFICWLWKTNNSSVVQHPSSFYSFVRTWMKEKKKSMLLFFFIYALSCEMSIGVTTYLHSVQNLLSKYTFVWFLQLITYSLQNCTKKWSDVKKILSNYLVGITISSILIIN